MPTPIPEQITTHLLNLTPTALKSATTHPFLRSSGTGLTPKPLLATWLSQDRLYAQSYVRFMGLLLAKINLPVTPSRSPVSVSATEDNGKGKDAHEKILGILVDALNNIQTELSFFEETAREYGLDLNTPFDIDTDSKFGPNPITHAYIDMFMAAGSPGVSLLEGLVVLWATEVCYLRAWRYAASFLGTSEGGKGEAREDADGGALRNKLIPNWASDEFEAFVGKIAAVVDEVAAIELGDGTEGDLKTREVLGHCERWWMQVVWLEEQFWPDVSDV
ncbi:hypothetical protein BJY04DRAFT_186264 [Aspergillus karnatakaensis]|uniref:putative transcription regulator PAB1642 n=1 Tax=Aspergillus karnatakaensis TaxID=1810916 RepID=UPI003CCD9B35